MLDRRTERRGRSLRYHQVSPLLRRGRLNDLSDRADGVDDRRASEIGHEASPVTEACTTWTSP